MIYSRYLSVYWCDMMSLEDTHPSTHEAFKAGDFVVQRSSSAFSQVAVDQTIEQTINRDTKSKGGIVGFSLNKGAVQRWLLTSHERQQSPKLAVRWLEYPCQMVRA